MLKPSESDIEKVRKKKIDSFSFILRRKKKVKFGEDFSTPKVD